MNSATPPVLALGDVRFVYRNGLQALDGVTFDVPPGQVVAVVGPSGCGKSTLLAIIAGLVKATSGSLEWNIPEVEPGADTNHRLSLLFQKDTVLPWRTVERNVEFGLENLGIRKAQRKKRVDDLLEVGELGDFRKSYPIALSGGMRRRLGLLMVMAVRPRVLLLDEPFAAVDEPTRVGLHEYVLKIVYEFGTSVVIVTHDLGEAITLGDTVHALSSRPGRVVASYQIPFGHDRDVYELRLENAYQDVYKNIWAETWSEKMKERAVRGEAPSIH